jgi:hypothetical protein
MNYRKSDRLHSYRFYRALQRQKSPMRYICEILSTAIFEFFNTIRQEQSFHNDHNALTGNRPSGRYMVARALVWSWQPLRWSISCISKPDQFHCILLFGSMSIASVRGAPTYQHPRLAVAPLRSGPNL